MSFADDVQKKQQAAQGAKAEAAKTTGSLKASDAVQKAVIESTKANIRHRDSHEPKVEVKNMPKDIATSGGVDKAIQAINNLNLTTFNASQPRIADLADGLTSLVDRLDKLKQGLEDTGLEPVTASLNQLLAKMTSLPKEISDITLNIEKDDDKAAITAIQEVTKAIKGQRFDPKITVPTPQVTVNEKEVDLSPLLGTLEAIRKALKAQKETDITPLIDAVQQTTDTIANLRFPVANYVLPFKSADGKDTQVVLDSDGNIPFTDNTPDAQAQEVTLLRIGNILSRPIYYNPVNNTIRVDINSGTVTTVTTVSTVSTVGNLQQVGTISGSSAGYDAKLVLTFPIDRTLWANAIRSNVS